MKEINIILDEKEFLSSKIDRLPCGIINKTETGIGATTVEINAKRNSIIVEPLKVTASTKAFEYKNALYVGSPTNLHPKKVSHSDIKKYIEDKSIEHKKIVVVSDSLVKVIEVLKQIHRTDFHLVIDESDSMQLDSNFRNSMETCYEIYKAYPKDKRCMLTATQIQFNDPDLKDEPITNISCKVAKSRNITINYTDNLLGVTLDKLKKIKLEHPHEKIVVSYNNVTKLKDLAIDIEKELSLSSNEISILCGANSQKIADKYYRELNDTIYPTYINLKTSAYHTGFDIKERYHLITIVDNTDIYNCISESKIKQIAGRCRHNDGLFSENIVYNYSPSSSIEPIKLDDLIDAADKEMKSLNCLYDNFGKSSILKNQIIAVRKLIADEVKCLGFQLVKNNDAGDVKISYLNIDAALETYRVKTEIYSYKDGLKNTLEKSGNIVDESHKGSLSIVKSKTDYNMLCKERLERIEENLSKLDISDLIDLSSDTSDKIEKLCYKIFCNLAPFLNKKELTAKILECANSRKSTKLENLYKQGNFSILEDKSMLKTSISSTFIIGKKYTKDDIFTKTKSILKRLGLSNALTNKEICMKLFHLLCKTTRNTKDTPTTLKILSYNTINITIEKHKKEELSFSDFFSSIM